MSIVLALLSVVLILVSLFLILIVLMQKSKDGGMGAALGGGMTEATFGAETGNVLTKSTIVGAILFFVIAFVLYLGRIYERKHAADAAGNALPTIAVPAAPKTAAPAAATSAPIAVPQAGAPASATTAPAPAFPVTTAPATTAPASSAPAPTSVPAEPAKKP